MAHAAQPVTPPENVSTMRLAERVAIVTGDIAGLGRAFALALAREGARVVVAEAHGTQSDAIAAAVRATGAMRQASASI